MTLRCACRNTILYPLADINLELDRLKVNPFRVQMREIVEAFVITSDLAKEEERREKETIAIEQRRSTHPTSLERGSEIFADKPEGEGDKGILGSEFADKFSESEEV